jgi:hypothetical protein
MSSSHEAARELVPRGVHGAGSRSRRIGHSAGSRWGLRSTAALAADAPTLPGPCDTVGGRNPHAVEPRRDLVGIEAQEVSPFYERDPSLRDEPPHVSFGDAQMLRDSADVEQPRQPFL